MSAPQTLKRILREKLLDSLEGPIPAGTPREVYGQVTFPGKATAVVGMRRAGKTTFLHQMRAERAAGGRTRSALPYLNFEDERLTGLEAEHLGFLVDELERSSRSASPSSDEPTVWCFDEIQVVPGWERFVRRLLDTASCEVFVTGSSAALLSREIATSLRGRSWEVLIHPFSFSEALVHAGGTVDGEAERRSRSARLSLEREFLDWLEAGGFPEAQGLDQATRFQLLRDYVDVAMLRDVVERHGVRNVTGLRWLVRHLLGNAAGSFSAEKFYGALKSQGVAIGKDTVHELLAHLEDCFLVRFVWMESSSERQRQVNPRKAYPIDAGLIPIYDRTGRANLGHALETATLIELERRRFEVTYVKTAEGFEVDFLARGRGGELELIQVCADASDPATSRRELRALVAAKELHPSATGRLLTATEDGLPSELPDGIAGEPAYEWMLRRDS